MHADQAAAAKEPSPSSPSPVQTRSADWPGPPHLFIPNAPRLILFCGNPLRLPCMGNKMRFFM
jgi:hypothetical protein